MPEQKAALTHGLVRDALLGVAKVLSFNFQANEAIENISTDSRTVGPNDLFVALKGDVFDGHNFIGQVVERGCRAILCEKYPAGVPQEGKCIFLVENSLDSFRLLASYWRDIVNPLVIAVAGSVGKTTTKDLITALLSERFSGQLLNTKGSQNGFIGIPMTIMGMRSNHEVALIEVGIDAPGAMIQHIEVVKPDVSIVTAISEEHLEWLKNLETIAYEENLILQETAKADGTAIINLDDPWISPLWETLTSAKRIGFSLVNEPTAEVLSGRYSEADACLEVMGLGQNAFEIKCPLPGIHNARNLLGAVAVALVAGVKPAGIQNGIGRFKSSGGRSELRKTPNDVNVLCDFYNANPASMLAAFAIAENFKLNFASPDSTTWLCLADMKELGDQEEVYHRDLAKGIRNIKGKVQVMLFGDKMRWLKDELERSKYIHPSEHFESLSELADTLKLQAKPGDFVVLKGSNSMKMGSIWEFIQK